LSMADTDNQDNTTPDPDTPLAFWPRLALQAQWEAWTEDEQASALLRCDEEDLEALMAALTLAQQYAYVLTHVLDPEAWSQQETLVCLLPAWTRDAGERLRISARYCALTGQKSSYKLDQA